MFVFDILEQLNIKKSDNIDKPLLSTSPSLVNDVSSMRDTNDDRKIILFFFLIRII